MITITNKLVLSILFSPVSTTVATSSMMNNIHETIVNNIVRWTINSLAMITVLVRHCSTNNAVTTCAICSCAVSNKLYLCTVDLIFLDHQHRRYRGHNSSSNDRNNYQPHQDPNYCKKSTRNGNGATIAIPKWKHYYIKFTLSTFRWFEIALISVEKFSTVLLTRRLSWR